jgi:hypothetical protein
MCCIVYTTLYNCNYLPLYIYNLQYNNAKPWIISFTSFLFQFLGGDNYKLQTTAKPCLFDPSWESSIQHMFYIKDTLNFHDILK